MSQKSELDIRKIIPLVAKGFRIAEDRTTRIITYVSTLMKEYDQDPAGALKEIPLNLKTDSKFIASFILGNYYSPLFFKMNDEQVEIFLSGISDALKIDKDREAKIIDYLTDDVMGNMTKYRVPFVNIIKNISESKFNDNEKDYLFFVYGLSFSYGLSFLSFSYGK